MRLLRWLGKAVLVVLLVCVVGLGIGFAFLHARYLKRNDTNIVYLKQHIVGAGPVAEEPTLSLPADLLDKKLVLLAEVHGTAAPQKIDLAMLRAMNAVGVVDYLAEVDPVEAAMLNRFLDTGDEAALKRVFDFWTPDAQWGNKDFEAKVRGIRALNATLPAARQVHYLGIDQMQDYDLAVEWLEAQLGVKADGSVADSLKQPAASKRAVALLTWMDVHKDAGADKQTLSEVRQALGQAVNKVGREKILFASYAYQVREGRLRDRPAYGMWGFAHGLQGATGKSLPFAAQVKASDLPAAKSLVTILCMGTNGRMMMPSSATPAPLRNKDGSAVSVPYGGDGPMMYMAGIRDLQAAAGAPGRTTIFRLDAPGSPYGQSMILGPHWSIFGSIPLSGQGAVTTDYAQYLAYSDGSAWVEPRTK